MRRKVFDLIFGVLSAVLFVFSIPVNIQAGCTSNADCNDGLFCNGVEFCDLGSGNCVALSPCPPFMDGCVIRGGTCDEVNDKCVDVADNGLCDDQDPSTTDTCDLATGQCQHQHTRSFTILHANDFHGQLEPSGSNPGAARVAKKINDVRTAVGASNALLLDAGDAMQGSLLTNLEKGYPVIDTFNAMGFNVATFGNHDFDWGQTVLGDRTAQATYPFVTANIVQNNTGNCGTAGWTLPAFADSPYQIITVNTVKVAVIGVTTPETPSILNASVTAGLCFKDPAESILHYYDEMKATGAKVIVVLSHLGYNDGGYGYGFPVYGDQTLASKLNAAGKPVDLIIGGHSHTNLPSATTVGATKVVQAYYNGRAVGRADITVDDNGTVSTTWTKLAVSTTDPKDPTIDALVTAYATDPAYLALINQPIGYSQVDLQRNYNGDNMMASFVDDTVFRSLNSDNEPQNDVDMFFSNAGGFRADICNGTCTTSGLLAAPMLLTYGELFSVLPFGNQVVIGDMTGAQIVELLHQSATLFKGAIQPSGIHYSFYRYTDALPGEQPYAWGAFEIMIYSKPAHAWVPLDLTKTYRVGTNEFLAPAGGDGFVSFKYMTNITYWGDMLNWLVVGVSDNYPDNSTAYKGPNGNGTLDGRIVRDGTDASGGIVPLTILHHNDSHGNLLKGSYVGYTQLATLIKQERAHNPTRTLLLSAGDNIQGDAMMYYFRTAPLGYASDGTPIADSSLHIQPLIKVFNSMNYDAMTLGNHEFNFGNEVFKSVLGQANFPLLQANVNDTGAYGLTDANILPYIAKTMGAENISVAIMGIGNHRVPLYELPTNIAGLTFSDPLAKAQELSTALRPNNDVVIALSHIGFTENPSSNEVDKNVDTNMAAAVTGIDAIIGGHSHTDPSRQTASSGSYKYLPSIVIDPDGKPVIINQAYRYNTYLGEVVLGLKSKKGGGYGVVSQTGRDIAVSLSGTVEDATTKAIIDPYQALLSVYNTTFIGKTTAPLDALTAFTQETNGANLQADAAVAKLSQEGIAVDIHLAGAVSNKQVAGTATPATPYSLTIADLSTFIPYEESLVVLSMNGPQLKAVLERAYRNYYYYKYVPGYGGYSYYTVGMLIPDSESEIIYYDGYPDLPNGNNVVSLQIQGVPVNFNDTDTYYNVSTLNYLAAGNCNFNNGDTSLWPLDQITADTQYYVRDAVTEYIQDSGTINPAIDGRLQFTAIPPTTTTSQPTTTTSVLPTTTIQPTTTSTSIIPSTTTSISTTTTVQPTTTTSSVQPTTTSVPTTTVEPTTTTVELSTTTTEPTTTTVEQSSTTTTALSTTTSEPPSTTTTAASSTTTTTEAECTLIVDKGFLPLRAGLFEHLRRIVIKGTNSEWDKESEVTIDEIKVFIRRIKDQETIIAWIIIPGKLIAKFESGTKEVRVQTPGKGECTGGIVIE